jgi:LCP family protein required for cell wall assembly
LNIALLGGDAGVGRRGVRTDTLMVVSIDPDSGNTALFQIPRNMARVPMPDGTIDNDCQCFGPIVNELWQYGERNPGRFPEAEFPGAEAVKAGLGELLGLDVHHFIMVNLAGFVEMIDALGGVDIVVTERVYDSNYPNVDGVTRDVIDIEPGEYHMDGELALAYSRSRQRSDDYNRMGRQSCMIRSVVDQTNPIEVLVAFPTLADIIAENVFTDIPLDRVPDLIALLSRVDLDRHITIAMNPPTYTGPRTPDRYNTPDLDAIRNAVATATSLPADEARLALGIGELDSSC